jgi:hypothetical protein
MTAPILFEITAADSHQQIILPVIRSLRERGIPAIVYSDCEVLRTASDPAALDREGIPWVRMADAPLPLPMREWEAAALPVRKRIPIELERVGPSLLVVLNDRNFPPNTYLKEARRLRIPTLLVQESLRKDLFQKPPWIKRLGRWRRKIRLGIEEGLRQYGQGGCDAVAAWGETSREYFLRVGVPESRIIVTGNPRFDQLANTDFSEEARRLRADLGYAPGDFLLAFLSSPVERMMIVSKEEKQEAFGRLIGWVRSMRNDPAWGNLFLAFKLHRSEDSSAIRSIIQAHNAEGWARTVDKPLYPFLKASQAALMFSSTAGLEAALLAAPLGILELSKPLDDWNLAARGVARGIRTPEDLAAFLKLAREDSSLGARGSQAAGFYLANIGRATEAVAGLAARMAGYAGGGTHR